MRKGRPQPSVAAAVGKHITTTHMDLQQIIAEQRLQAAATHALVLPQLKKSLYTAK